MAVKEINIDEQTLEKTQGMSTGEDEGAAEAGGWAGTDDATSTAPSDLMPTTPIPESERIVEGVADLSGHAVEDDRDWEIDSVIENEKKAQG